MTNEWAYKRMTSIEHITHNQPSQQSNKTTHVAMVFDVYAFVVQRFRTNKEIVRLSWREHKILISYWLSSVRECVFVVREYVL